MLAEPRPPAGGPVPKSETDRRPSLLARAFPSLERASRRPPTQVENVYVNNSDDGVCMKSGLDGFGINLAIPTEDVLVRNITCGDRRA